MKVGHKLFVVKQWHKNLSTIRCDSPRNNLQIWSDISYYKSQCQLKREVQHLQWIGN